MYCPATPTFFRSRRGLRLIADIIGYSYEISCFNPISITGYHAREAEASAVQEVWLRLAAANTHVETMLARGIAVDVFAPRLSFHFSSQRDYETVNSGRRGACGALHAAAIWGQRPTLFVDALF
ncbi:MAG: methylmalonyl-CoA mutase family protein [Anaerolineae bacterium]